MTEQNNDANGNFSMELAQDKQSHQSSNNQTKNHQQQLQETAVVHEKVVKQSTAVISHLCRLGFLNSFNYSLRYNVFVLYCESFTDNEDIIYIILCLDWIVTAFSSGFVTRFGDNWYYEKLLIIGTIIEAITSTLEATAVNITMLGIIWVLDDQPITSLISGYIGHILPNYYSQQYITKYYQYYVFGYVCGPVLSGIIATYLSLRSVYIIAAGMSFVNCIYFIVFVYNKEKMLRESQALLITKYNEIDNYSAEIKCTIDLNLTKNKWIVSKDYRFASISHASNNINNSSMNDLILEHGDKSNKNDDNDDNNDQERDNEKVKEKEKISKYQWLVVGISMINNALVTSNEIIFSLFAIVYIRDEYNPKGNSTVLFATGMNTVMLLFGVVGMQIMTMVNTKFNFDEKKINHSTQLETRDMLNDDTNENGGGNNNTNATIHIATQTHHSRIYYTISNATVIIQVIGCIFQVFLCNFFFSNNMCNLFNIKAFCMFGYKTSYWVYAPFYGILMGMLVIASKSIMIQSQPSHLSGSVQGTYFFILCFLEALTIFAVGMFFDANDYQWFWYFQSVLYSLYLLGVLILAGLESISLSLGTNHSFV